MAEFEPLSTNRKSHFFFLPVCFIFFSTFLNAKFPPFSLSVSLPPLSFSIKLWISYLKIHVMSFKTSLYLLRKSDSFSQPENILSILPLSAPPRTENHISFPSIMWSHLPFFLEHDLTLRLHTRECFLFLSPYSFCNSCFRKRNGILLTD